jgi:hypothetical protein
MSWPERRLDFCELGKANVPIIEIFLQRRSLPSMGRPLACEKNASQNDRVETNLRYPNTVDVR